MNKKLTKARVDLVFDHPFFGAIALRLGMVLKPQAECPTMQVDGYSIFYCEEFLEDLSVAQITGLLAHEVMHVVLLHHTRIGNRDHERWNRACDFAINLPLLDAGLQLPPNGCVEERFRNMTAEKIYEILKQENPNDDGPPTMGPGQGTPFDEIIPPPKDKKVNAEQDAKEITQTGLIAGKKAGKMPKSIEDMILAEQESQVAWGDKLREFLTSRTQGRPTWSRPNARLLEEAYLPYNTPEPSGELLLMVDESGSVSDAELIAYASELKPIMLDNNITKMTIIYFTSQVDKVEVYTDSEIDNIKLSVNGRGGTCFESAFKYAEEHVTGANAILVFTDGEDSFDFAPPEQPVLWCITAHRDNYVTPPWGQVIELEF